jgi:hypothetical protein
MHRLRLGPSVQMPCSARAPGEVPIKGFTAHLQDGTLASRDGLTPPGRLTLLVVKQTHPQAREGLGLDPACGSPLVSDR